MHPETVMWFTLLVSAIFSFAITVALTRRWWRKVKRSLPIPGPEQPPLVKYKDDPKLCFRKAVCQKDIELLEETEDYGDAGVTNVEQVVEWWEAYKSGNYLAVYDGRVIGGIDIWPLKPEAYRKLLSGADEESISSRDFQLKLPVRQSGSYWYIGSISMLPRVNKLHRAELIIRLLVTGLRDWQSRLPSYPANLLALAWTRAGSNILQRNGFVRSARNPNAYERVFESEAELMQAIVYWEKYIQHS